MKFCRCIIFSLFVLIIGNSLSDADEIKGKIQAINSGINAIEISGVCVVAQTSGIENEMDQPIKLTALAVGDHVDADGYFNAPGQMLAIKIGKDDADYDEIKGRVERVDLEAKEIFISGIRIKIPQDAYLKGKQYTIITLEQISASEYIDCRGSWTGPKEFTANKVYLD